MKNGSEKRAKATKEAVCRRTAIAFVALGPTISLRRPAARSRQRCCDGVHRPSRCEPNRPFRSEEHTSELQSLMRISYAVFCLKKKKKTKIDSTRKYIDTTLNINT